MTHFYNHNGAASRSRLTKSARDMLAKTGRAPVSLAAPEGFALDGYAETVREIDGRRVRVLAPDPRTARPALERDAIQEDRKAGPDAEPVTLRARVWRVQTNPAIRYLPADLRAAALAYADAVEALAGGGGQDFLSAGGGGGACNGGPSLARLSLAGFVARAHAALDAAEPMSITVNSGAVLRMGLRDLAHCVLIEGRDRFGVLARLGLSRDDHGPVRLAGEVALSTNRACEALIAAAASPRPNKRRNTPRR